MATERQKFLRKVLKIPPKKGLPEWTEYKDPQHKLINRAIKHRLKKLVQRNKK